MVSPTDLEAISLRIMAIPPFSSVLISVGLEIMPSLAAMMGICFIMLKGRLMPLVIYRVSSSDRI